MEVPRIQSGRPHHELLTMEDRLNASRCPFGDCDKPPLEQGFYMRTLSDRPFAYLHFCFPACAARAADFRNEMIHIIGAPVAILWHDQMEDASVSACIEEVPIDEEH